ncbi:uncharacterized protein [Maniola hyperantus]|uniref:uncharacterized protein n=1 Tax=Aphantopus hyperantus TaxID=2795564 RepID=UPI003748F5EE
MVVKKCASCNKNITRKSPGLECSRCNKVVHADPSCTKLSNKQLHTLKNATGIEWSCEECLQNVTRRSSFIIPDDDADEDSDSGHTLHSKSVIDTRKLVQDISRELKKTFREEISQLETSLEFLHDQLNNMEQSMKAQDTKIKTLEHKNQDLCNKNKHLELRVAVLEQGARQNEQNALSSSLEIAGLPDFPPVELDNVITAVASKLNVDKGVIQSTQRLSSGKDKPCTILLELKTKNVRNEWITASKEKSISVAQVLPNVVKEKADDRVFVREALTKHVKTLLFNAKLKLRNSFQFVWCKDGKVCARKSNNSKIFYIRCLQDIDLVLRETAI